MAISAFDTVQVRIHPAGWPFIAGFAVVAFFLGWFWQLLGWIAFALTAWCAYFFRDPDRVTPTRDGLIVSPADGIVQMIEAAVPPPELGMDASPRTRVSLFMNVFNVHVNRIPADGTVLKTAYRPGKFLNASLDKASEDNERMSVRLSLNDNRDLAFVQIAGLLARRILCDLKESQTVHAGDRFGLIRFGSRVDIYLPSGVVPLVVVGQTAIGGETVLADALATADEPARTGETRP